MFRRIPILAAILLTGCVLQPPVQKDAPAAEPVPATERSESNPDEHTVISFGTGALAERLLPTGVLDTGNTDAPVTLLLFTEHHCDYCSQFHTKHFPRLVEDFIKEGTLRFQVVPLELRKYQQSRDAAKGLICTALQGQGFAFHDTLMRNLGKERLLLEFYADQLDIDMKQFEECIESEQADHLLLLQKSAAKSLDVTLVPTLFVNGEKQVGLPYYADLRGEIEELLARE